MTDRIIPFPRTPTAIERAIESAPRLGSPAEYNRWAMSVLHEAQMALIANDLAKAKTLTAVALGAISNMMREE